VADDGRGDSSGPESRKTKAPLLPTSRSPTRPPKPASMAPPSAEMASDLSVGAAVAASSGSPQTATAPASTAAASPPIPKRQAGRSTAATVEMQPAGVAAGVRGCSSVGRSLITSRPRHTYFATHPTRASKFILP
jgi:hypothetical protein